MILKILPGSENLHGRRIISCVGPKLTKLRVANFSIFWPFCKSLT